MDEVWDKSDLWDTEILPLVKALEEKLDEHEFPYHLLFQVGRYGEIASIQTLHLCPEWVTKFIRYSILLKHGIEGLAQIVNEEHDGVPYSLLHRTLEQSKEVDTNYYGNSCIVTGEGCVE